MKSELYHEMMSTIDKKGMQFISIKFTKIIYQAQNNRKRYV